MSWPDLSDWWREEVSSDTAYEMVMTPLLIEMLQPEHAKLYLDMGCGEGRIMRTISESGYLVHGLDISESTVSDIGLPVVVGEADSLPLQDDSYDGVFLVLMLEHVQNHVRVFAESARVTRAGGVLALVCNHPVWTAPDSTPITDNDGEVLWRPGDYFSDGSSRVPAGESEVIFHHRTMAALLNAAADAGWSLEHMIEQPHHEFTDQAGIPRLLACRWSLLA